MGCFEGVKVEKWIGVVDILIYVMVFENLVFKVR